MRPSKRPDPSPDAARLVKTWLPAALVREMDQTILASGGAYNGRDDFIREAIADRVAEERMRPVRGPAPVILLPTAEHQRVQPAGRSKKPQAAQDQEVFGPVPTQGVPTLPPHSISGPLYGLHNRDYPTLWAALSLIAMVADERKPISWSKFTMAILEAAWKIGTHLARLDQERGLQEMKAAVGFPLNREKRQSSEARFVLHMVGAASRETALSGPLFAMQLAGLEVAGTVELSLAPTERGVVLCRSLVESGLSARPPHPERAWKAFRNHLKDCLPDDYAAWIRVLQVVVTEPTREELVGHFTTEWPGAAAATNVAGYVSRGREWGLVERRMKGDRYALTDRGRRQVEERNQ